MTHPPLHTVMYGYTGAGKSTGAVTFPKSADRPMKVCCFDRFAKARPYLKAGIPSAIDTFSAIPHQEVYDAKGEVIISIDYFVDSNPKDPKAWSLLISWLENFDASKFSTVVFDSLTSLALICHKHQEYRLNPNTKDTRQWSFGVTHDLEELLMIQTGSWLSTNVVLIAHIDEDKDELHGTFLRNPKVPGRLRRDLGTQFTELYRAYVMIGDHGQASYWWQTRSDGIWNAASQYDAPNPCPPHYDAIWAGQ